MIIKKTNIIDNNSYKITEIQRIIDFVFMNETSGGIQNIFPDNQINQKNVILP